MTTVWERRDLPVLRQLASDREHLRVGFLHLSPHAEEPTLGLDLSASEVHDAVLCLGDVGYVEAQNLQYETGPGAMFTGLRVTGRGQQALGEWPLFDEIAAPETLALLLERFADEAPTDEEADNLRRAASYARTLGLLSLRAAAAGALSHLARVGLGLG
jgi:hypothetical protein